MLASLSLFIHVASQVICSLQILNLDKFIMDFMATLVGYSYKDRFGQATTSSRGVFECVRETRTAWNRFQVPRKLIGTVGMYQVIVIHEFKNHS